MLSILRLCLWYGFSVITCSSLSIFISKALEGKISLSLNAWTSSNCYAFLAMVVHYITNEGEGECGESSNGYLFDYCSHLL